jgi:hypothetical protein
MGRCIDGNTLAGSDKTLCPLCPPVYALICPEVATWQIYFFLRKFLRIPQARRAAIHEPKYLQAAL